MKKKVVPQEMDAIKEQAEFELLINMVNKFCEKSKLHKYRQLEALNKVRDQLQDEMFGTFDLNFDMKDIDETKNLF